MIFTPRKYQDELSDKAVDIISEFGIVYLALEVRTGKTFTALMTADKLNCSRVLFLTVKKAIHNIQEDVDLFDGCPVDVLSIDSAHKADPELYDLIIVDEAHGLGSFPKPAKRARAIRIVCKGKRVILLSGTPNPESLSQLYHQFWISDFSPWRQWSSFYKWAKDYVKVSKRKYNSFEINDYSNGIREKIEPDIEKYFLTYSQKQADFICEVKEHIVDVDMNKKTMNAIKILKKDKVITSGEVVLADTPVKMMSKVHQMCSGTVITEENGAIVFDDSKAKYIQENFVEKKLAIFYKYQAEFVMLKELFKDSMTTEVKEFNETDKHIVLQIRAGSKGINLSKADCQVFFNIDFSSENYIQAKARLQTQKRESVDVFFLFAKGGIEETIYASLQKKKDFTSRYFKNLF